MAKTNINYMTYLKYLILSAIATLAPIQTTMTAVGVLIFADLILGITAAVKRGDSITSSALRRTISKILVYQIAIITGFICEKYLISDLIPMSKLIAGVIGMVEMKSLLEHGDELNGSPIFKTIIKKLGSDNDKP